MKRERLNTSVEFVQAFVIARIGGAVCISWRANRWQRPWLQVVYSTSRPLFSIFFNAHSNPNANFSINHCIKSSKQHFEDFYIKIQKNEQQFLKKATELHTGTHTIHTRR